MYKVHNSHYPPIFTSISSVKSENLKNSQSNCYILKSRTESGKGILHNSGNLLYGKKSRSTEVSQCLKIVKWERFVTALIKLDILCFKFAIVFYSLDVVSVIWSGLVHILPEKAFYVVSALALALCNSHYF